MRVQVITVAFVGSLVFGGCGGLASSGLFADGGTMTGSSGNGSLATSGSTSPLTTSGATTFTASTSETEETSATSSEGFPILDASGPPPPKKDAAIASMDATTSTPDATPDEDTGSPGGPSVPCGDVTCEGSTPVCCVSGATSKTPSATCAVSAKKCPGGSLSVECSTSSDCSSGDVCCAAYTYTGNAVMVQNITCESMGQCTGYMNAVVCNPGGPSSQCPNGGTCTATGVPDYGYCAPQGFGGK